MAESFRTAKQILDTLKPAPISPSNDPATRQGQREIVAATLTAAVVAASRERITPEEAAAKFREMMRVVWEG